MSPFLFLTLLTAAAPPQCTLPPRPPQDTLLVRPVSAQDSLPPQRVTAKPKKPHACDCDCGCGDSGKCSCGKDCPCSTKGCACWKNGKCLCGTHAHKAKAKKKRKPQRYPAENYQRPLLYRPAFQPMPMMGGFGGGGFGGGGGGCSGGG